jgi:alginate O-acetyltransferase complex protein AlgI
MIFTEPVFLLFFAVCWSVHWLLGSHRRQKLWLIACSYFFYGSWDWRFLGLIVAATCVDYLVAQQLERHTEPATRKLILFASLAFNLGVLGFFKYFNFFVQSGTGLLHWLGLHVQPKTLPIVLPVGISFITFQTLSYTLDVYRRELAASRSFLDFAFFVSFFPQLVAGPIVRARDFLPQLAHKPQLAGVEGRRMLLMFLGGFLKKACLADNLARAIDPIFAKPGGVHGLDAALAALSYSVQIYCDFSGYSDMAIAVAGMLGYRLVKNFDFPYFSRDVQEFWRRWHMSLSSWLRDYLYISLGGSRGSRWFTYRNLFLTMLLGGLWHGANTTFLVWGALHGAALIAHRAYRQALAARQVASPFERNAAGQLLAWWFTLAWVVFCFTIFRAPTLDRAWLLLGRLEVWSGTPKLSPDFWLLLPGLAGVHFVLSRHGRALYARVQALPDPAFYLGYGACSALVPYFMPVNAQPFIYFQF